MSLKRKKRLLIVDGGGNSGCFYGGVITTLLRNGINYNYFDVTVATSVGFCTWPFFMTGQIEQGLHYYTKHLPQKYVRFRSLFGGLVKRFPWLDKIPGSHMVPGVDVGYLEWAFRESEDALDVPILRSRAQELWGPVCNAATGQTEFHKINNHVDPVLLMLQSCYTPWLSQPYELAGNTKWDGGLRSQPPVDFLDSGHIELEDIGEIWFISPYPESYRAAEFRWRWIGRLLRWGRQLEPTLARLIECGPMCENALRRRLASMHNIHTIRPRVRPRIHAWSTDLALIAAVMQEGERATESFLKDYRPQI